MSFTSSTSEESSARRMRRILWWSSMSAADEASMPPPGAGWWWCARNGERRDSEDLRRSSSILDTTSMGRCLASTSGGSPDLATRWEHVVHSWCRSCFRDAISTFITSSIDAFSTMPASCFCKRAATEALQFFISNSKSARMCKLAHFHCETVGHSLVTTKQRRIAKAHMQHIKAGEKDETRESLR
uniref:Uncharacterized protein n=1 Tax=Zea mays TaxID=4577 RepID=C4J4X7_MAIZE|nr:unknown [Zea mays]